jgi:hypothetical protein
MLDRSLLRDVELERHERLLQRFVIIAHRSRSLPGALAPPSQQTRYEAAVCLGMGDYGLYAYA